MIRNGCTCLALGAAAALAVSAGVAEAATIPGSSLQPTVWLRADALQGLTPTGGIVTPLPANNSSVSTWRDSSGNSRNAVQTVSAQQPKFITNAINGKPVVRFDGSSTAGQGDFMNIGGGPWANTDLSKLTLFIVSNDNRLVGDVNNRDILSTRDNHGNGWVETYEPSSAQQRYVHIGLGSGSDDKVDNLLNTDAFHVLELRRNGLNIELGHDGGLQSTGVLDDFKPTTLTVTQIGNNNNDVNRFFRGDIAEIIAFDNTSLTDAQRASVEQYLLSKYAIPAAVPVPEPTSLAAIGLLGAVSTSGRRRRTR
jgi:hypothetical protein